MKNKFLLLSIGLTLSHFAFSQCNNSGIGTLLPNAKFEIRGCGTTSVTAAFKVTNSTDTTTTPILFLRNDKRVGIGLDNPSQKLEVAGTIFSNTGGFKFPDGSTQTSASPFAPATGSTALINNLGGGNTSTASYSLIGAGQNNVIESNAPYGVILGGSGNFIENNAPPVNNSYNFISGGENNTIRNSAHHSSIIGGSSNFVDVGAYNSVVVGGSGIHATTPNTVYMPNVLVSGLANTSEHGYRMIFIDSAGNLKTIPGVPIAPPCVGMDPLWRTDGQNNVPTTCDAIIGNISSFHLQFKIDNNLKMIISVGGNVGIGVGTPTQRLEVGHNSTSGGIALNRLSSTTAKSEIKFNQNGAEKWAIGNDLGENGGNNFFIWDHTNTATRFYIDAAGRVGIGVIPPTAWASAVHYKLYVEDGIATRDVKVTANAFPDYVFEKGYELMPIEDLEKFIDTTGHLPNFPSAKQVQTNDGFELGAMQENTLKQMEEMTLYIIELKKQINALNAKVDKLSNK